MGVNAANTQAPEILDAKLDSHTHFYLQPVDKRLGEMYIGIGFTPQALIVSV